LNAHSIVCTGGSGWVGATGVFSTGFGASGGEAAAGLLSTGAGTGGACAVSGLEGADCGRGFGVTSGADDGMRLATFGTDAGGLGAPRMVLGGGPDRSAFGGGNVGP
jgi:hypothetical protein